MTYLPRVDKIVVALENIKKTKKKEKEKGQRIEGLKLIKKKKKQRKRELNKKWVGALEWD